MPTDQSVNTATAKPVNKSPSIADWENRSQYKAWVHSFSPQPTDWLLLLCFSYLQAWLPEATGLILCSLRLGLGLITAWCRALTAEFSRNCVPSNLPPPPLTFLRIKNFLESWSKGSTLFLRVTNPILSFPCVLSKEMSPFVSKLC